ncbi:hypothetical protein HFO60_27415 [Rhizobium leguminosarum]|uniref:hypothetical protein n=1 Tax=Rhizobium leguminosarum TaxID=384 RepID=UPI001C98B302|nr:hypothetical protein [Rhizobium leguminosarum]MBY5543694.1 hypothetical protein [Rhizobium leguminosarum]
MDDPAGLLEEFDGLPDDVDPENPKGDWPITGLVVIPDIAKIIFKRQKQLRLSV